MATATKLIILILMAIGSATFGYQEAFNYAAKQRSDKKQLQLRLARIDLWSYVLTSVPLFGGIVLLLNKDPIIGQAFEVREGWSDLITASLLLVASLGIGAGIARRRWTLINLTEQ